MGPSGGGNGSSLHCSCLENPMDRGAWRAMVHGVARVGYNLVTKPSPPPASPSRVLRASLEAQMVKNLPAVRETWIRSLGHEDPLEKRMATHSSILAWKIPWTEEPGRLQFTGLQWVGHGWATNTFTFHLHVSEPYVPQVSRELSDFAPFVTQRSRVAGKAVKVRE